MTPSANCKGLDDWTGLHYAAQDDSIEIMEVLLSNKASPDSRSQIDRTPLHMACLRGCLNAGMLLLDHGADPNV